MTASVTLHAEADQDRRADGGPARALADGLTMTRRNLIRALREPFDSLLSMFIPVMLILLFGYVFVHAMAPGGDADAYRVFLVPGLLAMVMLNGVGSTAAGMALDADRAVMGRFRSLPMAPSALLTGRAASDMVKVVLELVPMVTVGLLMGWRWEEGILPGVAALLLLMYFRLAMTWLGIFLGLVTGSADTATMIVYPLVFPMSVLSTMFMDSAMMPGWLAPVAEWNPVSATVNAGRELFGTPAFTSGSWASEHALLLALVWPTVLIAVLAPVSIRMFRRTRD